VQQDATIQDISNVNRWFGFGLGNGMQLDTLRFIFITVLRITVGII
jgi:hypothetical protein